MLLNETKEWGPASNIVRTVSSSEVDPYDVVAINAMNPAVFINSDDFGEELIL